MRETNGFQVIHFPRTRRAIADMLREGQRKHLVHGLGSVDVTLARQLIREHRLRTGERLSFTAFMITCLARAVDEHKIMHAYRKGKSHLVLFDDVDVNTQIERQVEGGQWVMPYIIRAANHKTFRQIHEEIRAAQTKELADAREYRQFAWYLRFPPVARRLVWWGLQRSPHWTKKLAGTVGMTAIGMFTDGGGWGIPITIQTLLITLGGISEKPRIVEGRVEAREFLDLTITLDHDIIDGGPAARFLARLKELVENGWGLMAEVTEAEHGEGRGS